MGNFKIFVIEKTPPDIVSPIRFFSLMAIFLSMLGTLRFPWLGMTKEFEYNFQIMTKTNHSAYQPPEEIISEMTASLSSINRKYYWRGILIGPFAFPPFFALALLFRDGLHYGEGSLEMFFYICICSVLLTCLVCVTYGTIAIVFLRKMGAFSLANLLMSSIIPALVIWGFSQDWLLSIVFSAYSFSVCLLCWFAGLKKI